MTWAQITDSEVAEGVIPSSILFQKLKNNPRAVMYGDPTVPHAKLILAESTEFPTVGVSAGEFFIVSPDDGVEHGTIDVDDIASCASYYASGSPSIISPFPESGLYTLILIGNGGDGASSQASSSQKNGGGAGAVVKVLVNAAAGDTVELLNDGADGAYAEAVDGSWRLDAGHGADGTTATGLEGIGKGGRASFSGFAQGYAIHGGCSRNGIGGRAGYGGSYGVGGDYQASGQLGTLHVIRGVHI